MHHSLTEESQWVVHLHVHKVGGGHSFDAIHVFTAEKERSPLPLPSLTMDLHQQIV